MQNSDSDDRPNVPAVPPPQRGFFKGSWHRWTQLAHSIGVVQTRIIMVGFYILLAVPTGLFMRLTGDRLRLKRQKDGNWVPHRDEPQSLDTAKRQF